MTGAGGSWGGAAQPRFIVIGLGVQEDRRVVEGLEQLAAAGGGRYVAASDAATLSQALQRVGGGVLGGGEVAAGATPAGEAWLLMGFAGLNLALVAAVLVVLRRRARGTAPRGTP